MAIAGFKTALGSIYAVDDPKDGRPKQTTRLKVSYGEGRGEVSDTASSCLFVSEEAAELLDKSLVQGKRIVMLHSEGDKPYVVGEPLTTINYENAHDVPAAKNFFFGILDQQGNWETLVKASTEPEPGLRPMEQCFERDGSLTNHIGNTITEIFESPSELLKAAMKAAKTLGHTSSRRPPNSR